MDADDDHRAHSWPEPLLSGSPVRTEAPRRWAPESLGSGSPPCPVPLPLVGAPHPPRLTSSNFLALYWSAPLRKFSRMMSQRTVPWRWRAGRLSGAAGRGQRGGKHGRQAGLPLGSG